MLTAAGSGRAVRVCLSFKLGWDPPFPFRFFLSLCCQQTAKMAPALPPRRSRITKRDALGPGFDDDDDDDGYNPWSDWNEKSYNGPGGGNSGSDEGISSGDFGRDGERNNIDFDLDDRVTSRDNGLSGGQIAAIAVSIVVFFLLVSGLCFWRDRRRKKRRLAEEQTLADDGVKRDVYMKEQGEGLSPVSPISTQGVGGTTPTPGQGIGGQDAPPPYEPRQPEAAHVAGGDTATDSGNWRQSRLGTEEDDIMVTDGMPPDSGRQREGKGSGGLEIGT
ncbi:uncharacterized protein PODANS_3_2740 [Podospora anserina S mat+]|uniref:Podospora anserina S mat+ genomic DNA chromosome 3, supercontig 2 n=1 Tax=Podospora anserina (strain S / ATCC MYA-4624 / DSM 980 / FGSC 10383) TaxID=515849 RepID=B2AZS5_PODAN|nr:uncharacterized protein PODANS_3_2740 [Podospora anserina S mat+]CAP70175.1 unnamed protein product [Podospora anserina S mat+]CDP26768.1 Putative protein of unknown function [Podospora anserina S mat+]